MADEPQVLAVGAGELCRIPHTARRGEETHWSFKTERIANGARIGSLLGRIDEVCENGCCVWVRPPEDIEQHMPPFFTRVEDLLAPHKGDTDGTTNGPQYAPVGEGPDVQGLRRAHERAEGREAVRDPVQAGAPIAQGATQGLTPEDEPASGFDLAILTSHARGRGELRGIDKAMLRRLLVRLKRAEEDI